MIRIAVGILALAAGAVASWKARREFRRCIRRSALRALDTLSDSVSLVDRDLRIVWRSSSVSENAGNPSGAWLGRSIGEGFHPDDAEDLENRLRRLLGSPGTEDRFEARILCADGGSLPVECVARNLFGMEGIDALLVQTRDIAEQVRDRERFDGALDQAQKLAAEKNQFLAVVGHEIRTPLQALESALRTQAESTTSDAERAELRSLSLRSATSLLQILDDLLELSRVEARVMPVRSEPFDAMEVTRDVADIFAVQARAKGGSVRALQEGRNPPLKGDAARIRQILANLVGNSVRHAGGSAIEVVFRVRTTPGDRVLCHWEIRDRGPGLSSEEAAAMFRMWQRGSQSAGSGLGLAIVQGLVEVMGGSVEATRRSGGGLSVHVHLPMDSAPEEISAPGSSPEARSFAGSRRILVAEDDRTNQIVIRRQLENLGCSPSLVPNGQAALDALDHEAFDLLLLDCQMPVLDGYATCREIRRREGETGRPRLPVLAVTAWAMQADKDQCFTSGMDEVLTKPLRPAELAEALGRWLPKVASG